jgi:hypothetical protein
MEHILSRDAVCDTCNNYLAARVLVRRGLQFRTPISMC